MAERNGFELPVPLTSSRSVGFFNDLGSLPVPIGEREGTGERLASSAARSDVCVCRTKERADNETQPTPVEGSKPDR